MKGHSYWSQTNTYHEKNIAVYPDETGKPIHWMSVIDNNIGQEPGKKTIELLSGRKISAWIKDSEIPSPPERDADSFLSFVELLTGDWKQ